jgi:diguanylate cyclase (GGDEF)-like protein
MPGEALADRLAGAGDVAEAAELVVDHLTGLGLPSLYLVQGGRLRCVAQRGYWQVLDGIPTDVGVMSRALRTGRTVVVDDAVQQDGFLFAAPDLRQQVAVPIRISGDVVGVLNVESTGRLPDGVVARAAGAAEVFADRVAQLGGPPPESLAQRVARLATTLVELDDEPALHRAVVDAACELSGMDTAAIVLADDGEAQLAHLEGPSAGALHRVGAADLADLDAFVRSGSSLHASGTDESDLAMHGRLRRAGVASLVVVSLVGGGHHLGSLLAVSHRPRRLDPTVLAVLEILGAQAGASLRAVRESAELQRRAARDPLTDLGHHATFHAELTDRLGRVPPDRQLAVLLLDVDGFKGVNDRFGHRAGDRLLRELSDRLSAALRGDDRLYRIGGDEFATIVEVRRGSEADEVAERLLRAARGGPATVSVGVALARPGDTPATVLERADVAMYDAKRAGKDTRRGAGPGRDEATG